MPNVTCIGRCAFALCRGLKTVNIPDGITELEDYVFDNCGSLNSITIPESVTSIGQAAFQGCGLDAIALPESLKIIGPSAFNGCKNLKSVTIPEGVTSIGQTAFQGCGLNSIIFPESIKNIGGDAFSLCEFLTKIEYASMESFLSINGVCTPSVEYALYINGDVVTDFTIPSTVTSIKDGLFCRCSSLKSITIPHSVVNIGANAFHKCSNLSSVTIPKSVTEIGAYAFNYCKNLSIVIIPNTVVTMGKDAFGYTNNYDYKRSNSIIFYCEAASQPNGWSNWRANDKSETVYWGINPKFSKDFVYNVLSDDSPYEIEVYKFNGNSNAVIPSNEVFDGNKYQVVGYGKDAFKNYNRPVLCLSTTPVSLTEDPFPNNDTVYVPATSVNTYKTSAIWKRKEIVPFYVVAAKSADDSKGTVTGDTILLGGLTLTLTAVPADGCHFVSWSDGNTEVVRHLTEAPSSTLVATFEAHTEVVDDAVAATCTQTGKTEGSHCSGCGLVFAAQEEIPALGHTEVVDSAVAATCTETGLTEGKHCSVCNVVLVAQEVIPANGHTEVVDKAIAATCTKTGLTEGKHCSVCNAVLVKQDTIPALGHTIVTDTAVAATCTKTGLTEGKHCSVCNAIIVEQTEIPMVEHTIVTDAAVAATATETGLTEGSHCSVCGAVIVAQEVIPALGEQGGENTNPGTAVAESAANAVNIYAHGNTIVVENATEEIRVYNAMGALVDRDVACRVRAEINVNGAGIYLVKVGNVAKRVMVH